MSEQNKQIARRLLDELWNRADFAVVDDLVPDDYNGHESAEIHGPEGAKAFVAGLRAAFPDLHLTVEDQLAERDKVVTRWTMRGTHKGLFQGIPATGRRMTITGIALFRISNGKIVEGWANEDVLGMLQQLGAIPTPGQTR